MNKSNVQKIVNLSGQCQQAEAGWFLEEHLKVFDECWGITLSMGTDFLSYFFLSGNLH